MPGREDLVVVRRAGDRLAHRTRAGDRTGRAGGVGEGEGAVHRAGRVGADWRNDGHEIGVQKRGEHARVAADDVADVSEVDGLAVHLARRPVRDGHQRAIHPREPNRWDPGRDGAGDEARV